MDAKEARTRSDVAAALAAVLQAVREKEEWARNGAHGRAPENRASVRGSLTEGAVLELKNLGYRVLPPYAGETVIIW